MHKITKISQAKRNPNRVNIFLDDEFWVSLTKSQLVELGLYKDQQIGTLRKEEIEKANIDGKLLEKVMKWLSLRPRSEKETFDYLRFSRKLTEAEAQEIVDYLLDTQHLDDERFAEWFVQNRVEFRFYGPRKIQNELYQKGIDSSYGKKLISKLYPQHIQLAKIENYLAKKSIVDLNEKVIRRLLSKGFEYSIIKQFV